MCLFVRMHGMIMNRKLVKGMGLFGFLMVLLLSGCRNQSEKALKNELAYRKFGINKIDEGDYQEAVEAFQMALDESMAMIRPLEIDICYYKALAQYKSGDVKGAIKTYTALIHYDEKNGDAFYLRGGLYLDQNDKEQALKDFKQAVDLDQNNYDLYIGIYDKYLAAGMEEQGLTFLEEALKLKGNKEEDYLGRGRVYFTIKDYANAKENLDLADPKDPRTILCLAGIYDAEGEKEKAKELYAAYLKEYPEDTGLFNKLGCGAVEEDNYEEALFYFQTALKEEEPDFEQELRRNEIAAYEYLSDFVTAKEKMESYLADYPEDEEAKREYAFLETRCE